MRLAFVINEFQTEKPEYTTTALALCAMRRGHTVWTLSVGDFASVSDSVRARACRAPRDDYENEEAYLCKICGPGGIAEDLDVSNLDILFLRNDPAEERLRPWARRAAVTFGRLAMRHGVLVVNDPDGLCRADGKHYLEYFPEELRPRTVISRDRGRIKQFIEQTGDSVVKPLCGSQGQNVFLVRKEERANLNQIIDAVARDGYVIAQEYLPAAAEGDTRFFMMNGRPLMRDGKYALFRRVRMSDDLRSNVHAGARIASGTVDERILKVAALAGPRLVRDGIFLAGLDIIGDKLSEINVYSPGGLRNATRLVGVDFCVPVIEALEHKARYTEKCRRKFDNASTATRCDQ